MFDILFAGQAEPAYKINYIASATLWGVSAVLLLGMVFLILAGMLFVLQKKIPGDFRRNFFILVLLGWLPLFGYFLWGNLIDLAQDFQAYGRYDAAGKRIIRLCLSDYNTGVFCGIGSFMKLAEQSVPKDSNIAIVSDPAIEPYLAYQSIPLFNLQKNIAAADYLLLYYPPEYLFRDGILYRQKAGSQKEIGRYSLLGARDQSKFILKAIR
jgi:hypothetical protein